MTTGPKRRPVTKKPAAKRVPIKSAPTPTSGVQQEFDLAKLLGTPAASVEPSPANLLAAQITFYQAITATANLASQLIQMAIEQERD